jgi:hypothetical protein
MAKPRALQAETAPKFDREEIMRGVHRKLMTFLDMPSRCRERLCRRTKRCVGPTMRCARDVPARPSTPEQEARFKADLLKALQHRLAELRSDAARNQNGGSGPPPVATAAPRAAISASGAARARRRGGCS